MEFEFTQAEEQHIAEIVALVNSAYRGASSKAGWTTEADLLDGQRVDAQGIQEMMTKEDSTILIATEENEDEGDILGCVHIEKQGPKMYLGMLTVSPTLQKKGLGKKLIEESEAFADFWDCTAILITVISQRAELIAWYEKLGFKRTGETKPFPKDDPRFGIPKVDNLEFVVLKKKLQFH